MSLFKLKTVSTILIEDDYNKNILPLVSELTNNTDGMVKIFCYEHPQSVWQKVFNSKQVQSFKDFQPEKCEKSNEKFICIIDSVNQMALELGWNVCLKHLRNLQRNPNATRIVLVLHKDCLSHGSKLQSHLNHISNAIVTYDDIRAEKVWIQIKKNGKYYKSEEILSYDSKLRTLKLSPVVKLEKKVEEPERVSPGSLTTFKIETDQIQQLEKHKLKLPYMSKINEGQGKVIYEPDAVDDWDDEDPDDDLDI